eukprot:scaffold81018_cov18-Tisochrysis_lutea.AAC.1
MIVDVICLKAQSLSVKCMQPNTAAWQVGPAAGTRLHGVRYGTGASMIMDIVCLKAQCIKERFPN